MEHVESVHLRMLINELRVQGRVHNITDFCTQIGKNKIAVSAMLNGKRKITENYVAAIRRVFPDVREDWLLNPASSQMFKDGPVISKPELMTAEEIAEAKDQNTEKGMLRQYVNEQRMTIIEQKDSISFLREQVTMLTEQNAMLTEQTARLTKMLDRMTEEPLKKTHTA